MLKKQKKDGIQLQTRAKKKDDLAPTTTSSLVDAGPRRRRRRRGIPWTNLFIYPPHEFSIANSMITNFHLPKTSLIIMIAAFGGFELIMEAYQEAIKEKYRFFSYGDAMLIL